MKINTNGTIERISLEEDFLFNEIKERMENSYLPLLKEEFGDCKKLVLINIGFNEEYVIDELHFTIDNQKGIIIYDDKKGNIIIRKCGVFGETLQ